MLERRTPLRAMSARRRQELAEAGNTNPFSTLTNGTARRGMAPRLAVPAPKKRPANTGPSDETVQVVWRRDCGRCVRCGGALTGMRGLAWSVQHRRARGAGGTRREDTNQSQALILLCGSAATGCHGHVEQHRAEAREFGWAVRQSDDPTLMPVLHAVHGWVLLTPAGGVTTYPPNHDHTPKQEVTV